MKGKDKISLFLLKSITFRFIMIDLKIKFHQKWPHQREFTGILHNLTNSVKMFI